MSKKNVRNKTALQLNLPTAEPEITVFNCIQ